MQQLGPHVSYRREGALALVEIDDPPARNALADEDVAAFALAAAEAARDAEVGALLIAGAGGHFCAGANIAKMTELLGSDVYAIRTALEAWQEPLVALERLEKPVVAAIDGLCIAAGVGLALACDIRVAAAGARIGFPSVNAGLVTDLGCTRRLPRVVGAGWAKHYLLTGAWIDAETALRIGLVTAVFPDEGFRDAAVGFVAEQLLPRSTRAQGVMKRLVDANWETGLDAALESERSGQALLYSAPDVREGHRAIVEKRAPRFGASDAPR